MPEQELVEMVGAGSRRITNKKRANLRSRGTVLRVAPEVHAAVATAAEVSGKSINQWASETLLKAAQ